MGRIIVETDIFEHRKVGPHFINRCCFGEDFAGWLRQELLTIRELALEFSEPIQEDYGWGLRASGPHGQFWIAVSYAGNGPQEGPVQWVVSISAEPEINVVKRLFHKSDERLLQKLDDSIRGVLRSNAAVKVLNA